MEEIEILREAGLSDAEARVYLCLLEAGQATAGPIIKKAGFHRGTCYQLLARLIEKGMATSIIKGKKRYFEAVSPERLLDVLKAREDRLKKALPRLKAMGQAAGQKQEITMYCGAKGIRSALDRMLEELKGGGEYYDFGVSGLLKKVMGPYWFEYQGKKKRWKVKSFVIFNSEIKENEPAILKEYFGKARFHPREYPSITDTFIYRDTVIIAIWTAKPPIAIVIKNEGNAKSYKNQFKYMWKHASKK